MHACARVRGEKVAWPGQTLTLRTARARVRARIVFGLDSEAIGSELRAQLTLSSLLFRHRPCSEESGTYRRDVTKYILFYTTHRNSSRRNNINFYFHCDKSIRYRFFFFFSFVIVRTRIVETFDRDWNSVGTVWLLSLILE